MLPGVGYFLLIVRQSGEDVLIFNGTNCATIPVRLRSVANRRSRTLQAGHVSAPAITNIGRPVLADTCWACSNVGAALLTPLQSNANVSDNACVFKTVPKINDYKKQRHLLGVVEFTFFGNGLISAQWFIVQQHNPFVNRNHRIARAEFDWVVTGCFLFFEPTI